VLTRIEIDGFKTFKDFALDVPEFLVVLGQNASGKSNLFDAIAFLSRLARGAAVKGAVRDTRGGLPEFVHRDDAGRRADRVRFAVELSVDDARPAVGTLRYELELVLVSEDPLDPEGTESLTIAAERWMHPDPGPDGVRRVWRPVPAPRTEDLVEGATGEYPYPARFAFRPEVGHTPDGLIVLVWDDGSISETRQQLASWQVLALEPSALRRPDSYEDDDRLSASGEHLPNALSRMVRRTRREDRPLGVLNDLATDMASIVPEVIGLRLDDDRVRKLRSVLVRTRGQAEYSARAISDGTLRALAMVTALRDPDESGLLCIEEPENGIYPRLLTRFVRRVARWTSPSAARRKPRQVMMTSHSPAVLAALADPPAAEPFRKDAVYFDLVARVGEDSVSRVTRARRVRTGAPLPRPLDAPVLSLAELDEFLGRGEQL